MHVSLYRDYKEEGWESMEVYADNLAQSLRRLGVLLDVREVLSYPALSRRIAGANKLMRYGFRFGVNPLFAPRHQGEINHIIDQANAHLLAVLDPRKTVVTCHDLIVPYWIMHNVPQTYKKHIKRIGELWRIRFLKKATRIIAVSQATKDDIVKTLGIYGDKIVVVPEGVDKAFKMPVSARALRQIKSLYALPDRYVLHVGTTHEYKNMEGLIKIFSSLSLRDRKLFLVKVGSPWTIAQQRLIHDLSLEQSVVHLGFVSKRDLHAIYAGALFLIHPSYTEGFGFTVLEAMATGCPVVVSDIPALREMVGAAGVYIQPNGTASDVGKVQSLLGSVSIRQRLKKLGKLRASLYTWERTASLTYNVYLDVASTQRSGS